MLDMTINIRAANEEALIESIRLMVEEYRRNNGKKLEYSSDDSSHSLEVSVSGSRMPYAVYSNADDTMYFNTLEEATLYLSKQTDEDERILAKFDEHWNHYSQI